jgi:methenyltetrahydromethanopterin cyclohydrolase
VKLIAVAPAVSVSAAIARVVERTEATVSENVFVAVAETASVTVTVYVAAELVAVGVPVIAPVELLIDKPAGSEGETEKEYGEVPYDPVTGMKEVAAADTARDFVATLWVAVSGPVETVRALVLVPMEFTAFM